ncbi:MAG: AAA family ATPase [Bacteroidales bacterium]|nr:AAA family ATPase [Bacteroidales bacterium]
MGTYINIGNSLFQSIRNSEYVDKSGLIAVVNGTLSTERRFSCVSRSRRFGKSMAAKMLCAYYDHSCNSRELFQDLSIAGDPSFEKHLNKYPVLYLDMTAFVTRYHDDPTIVSHIDARLREDVSLVYPEVEVREGDDLMDLLVRISAGMQERFIFIIDEWDAICREFKPGSRVMDTYVNWLRRMFKDVSGMTVFAGVYMTGILPIKKYKTESALNNFIEYSMVEPGDMAPFFGFTKNEVRELAAKHGMDFDELEKWYDGYQIGDEPSMFNPNSVMQALDSDWCSNYWGKTGSYVAVADYIKMNFEGLKDDILRMLAGGRSFVDPTGFQNDMSVVRSKDDVLTILIHLGYLSFLWETSECYIPNREVMGEMVNAVKANNWVAVALQQSAQLLRSTIEGDADAVARGVDAAHDENTSILSYNNENSLACVLSIAYYAARGNYILHRELPTGKGFADIVLYPRKNVDSPAVILELKFDSSADSAIDQIKRKEYPAKLSGYSGNLLLVGIAYDRKTKQHSCVIEKA